MYKVMYLYVVYFVKLNKMLFLSESIIEIMTILQSEK